ELSGEPHDHDRHGDGKEIFAGCQSIPLASNRADITGLAQGGDREFSHGCAAHSKAAGKSARYESIHKAVQYKNSGTTQIGIMNQSDVITMGLKEDFQCSRRAAAPKGGCAPNFTI